MSEKPRLDRVLALARANLKLQQFGQANSDEVHLGKTACTHTICQFLSLVWKGTIPTLNQVNRMAGMDKNAMNTATNKPRGMRPDEFGRFLKKAEIPMEIRRGLPFGDLLKASDEGPVFYAMRYGSAPMRTKSHPNGTTQTGGTVADTRHAVVMLGFRTVSGANGGPSGIEVYRKEPNHGSANRPEQPPFDTISNRQARIEYEAYHKLLGERLYAALPTRPLPVIGKFALPPVQAPPLVVTDLQPFDGVATVEGDDHFAVQIADREFFALADQATKPVVALGRLSPRLPGPAGDRTNVVIVGNEAAIMLRADITLRTAGGIEVPPPASEEDEQIPIGPPVPIPDGDPPGDDDNSASDDALDD